MDALAIASTLSLITNSVIEAIVEPIRRKYPNLDMWWLIYASWIIGGILAWMSGINLFSDLFPDLPMAGRVLTSILVGRGSNLIADVFTALRK